MYIQTHSAPLLYSLYSFVTSYQMAHLGPLPTSASGKMLQEIITTIPNVTLIGSKPSNIYVTLDATKGKTPGRYIHTREQLLYLLLTWWINLWFA